MYYGGEAATVVGTAGAMPEDTIVQLFPGSDVPARLRVEL